MPEKSPSGDILTVSEVAEILRVNPRTVYNLARKKKIPGRRIGNQWRFSRSKIMEHVEGAPKSAA